MRLSLIIPTCFILPEHPNLLFGTLVSGSNGTTPSYFDGPVGGAGLTPANHPHGAGWKKIGRNESVYIDYTCVVNGYTTDAERIFVMGTLPNKLMKAHDVALKIQETCMDLIKPGVSFQNVYRTALSIAEDSGLIDQYMGFGKNRVRFLGHGVGLELDELPVFADGLKMSIETGMTFALEPKFVFKEGAVGIENTFALTKNGIEKLNMAEEAIVQV